MVSMLATLFWVLLIVGIYPYLIYPLLAGIIGRLRNRTVLQRDGYLPTVTVITAAFNEAAHIEGTVRNKLTQDYPADKLDMIVVSDASDDGTDEIVSRLAREDVRVRLVRQEPRQGKTSGLNLAIRNASGEIIVFADANSIYRPDAVRMLVRNFADPAVGYVTGRMLYVNPDNSLVGDGCTAYMRLENRLRVAETRIGSVVGVDGGIDAVRRALYRPMRPDQLPDFVLPLSVVQQGARVIYEAGAVLTEETLTSEAAEHRMRVRVALRALWALWDMRVLLNPFRYGLFSWQLLSHKVLRYLSFVPLALAALCNWFLLPQGMVYQVGAVAQCVFALLVLCATRSSGPLAAWAPVRYCHYFFLLNWASAVALGRFLQGDKQVVWQPRVG